MEREDIDLLLDTARRWYRAHSPLDERVAHFRQGHREEADVWTRMAEMGWTGLSLPEASGGFGASQAACFEFMREAGRDARPEALGLHLLLAPMLATVVPQWAEALAGGAMRVAIADLTGPSAADDAVRWSDGQRLSGRVGTVLGGEHATHMLVPLREREDLSLALLDLRSAGIATTAARLVDSRASPRIVLDGAVAHPLDGAGLAQRALDLGAASLVADSAGVLDAAFALTLDYLKQRVQFGKPLSAQQALQHRMAEIFCDLQQLLALAGRLAAEIDAAPEGPWPTLAPAKSFVGRRALRAVGQLIQVSGGIAVTEEYRLTHFYRRLHVAAALFGDAEAQLARIDARRQLLPA